MLLSTARLSVCLCCCRPLLQSVYAAVDHFAVCLSRLAAVCHSAFHLLPLYNSAHKGRWLSIDCAQVNSAEINAMDRTVSVEAALASFIENNKEPYFYPAVTPGENFNEVTISSS